MKNQQLLNLLEDSKLSPERLAKRLHVSNMSVRRWTKKTPGAALPENLAKAVEDATFQLIVDGVLERESKSAKAVLKKGAGLQLQAAMKTLGIAGNLKSIKGNDQDKLRHGLSQMGATAENQIQVQRKIKKISAFQRWGQDWNERIGVLLKVLRSSKFTATDKLVAYGALFYLIWPFDLIPDNIPIIGYLDDYAILGLAASYYLRKYSKLLKDEGSKPK